MKISPDFSELLKKSGEQCEISTECVLQVREDPCSHNTSLDFVLNAKQKAEKKERRKEVIFPHLDPWLVAMTTPAAYSINRLCFPLHS